MSNQLDFPWTEHPDNRRAQHTDDNTHMRTFGGYAFHLTRCVVCQRAAIDLLTVEMQRVRLGEVAAPAPAHELPDGSTGGVPF